MAFTLTSRVGLQNGKDIPVLGFGTYESSTEEAYTSVKQALEAGYRHIQSVSNLIAIYLEYLNVIGYENEEACGRAINDFMKESNTPRNEIFYTTKLMANNGLEHARKAIHESVRLSGLGYLDLYLIHGPYPSKEARLASWKAIEEAIDEGLIKSAGVSNYGVRHLEELYETSPRYPVTINQLDLHPFMQRSEDVEYNKRRGIVLEAWGPLARAMRFNNPVLKRISESHSKSPAQVLLRWSIQKGYVPLPKSVKKERLAANKEIFDFELSNDDMNNLDQLDEYLVTDWDPIGDASV
ncbi:putative aldo-keto reductase [Wallemia mellicola]|nr:putative aldo-keto reductase [Wallemia mellicola]